MMIIMSTCQDHVKNYIILCFYLFTRPPSPLCLQQIIFHFICCMTYKFYKGLQLGMYNSQFVVVVVVVSPTRHPNLPFIGRGIRDGRPRRASNAFGNVDAPRSPPISREDRYFQAVLAWGDDDYAPPRLISATARPRETQLFERRTKANGLWRCPRKCSHYSGVVRRPRTSIPCFDTRGAYWEPPLV